MKKLLFVMVILAVSIGFAAAQDLADVDPSGQSVLYWHQYSEGSAQGDTMAALIEEFNSTNEFGITVEGVFQGSYGPIEELMETAIVSGELPNLVAGYANAASNWYNEGVVVDINSFLNDANWGISEADQANLNFNLLDINQLDFAPFDGARVAWANQNSVNLMYANLDMIERLGFDAAPPASLEEFEAIACAGGADESLNGGYPINGGASEFESWVAAGGGSIFDEEAGQWDFTTPEVIATFELYKRLFDNGCGYFFAERFGDQADFAAGLTPFTVGSSAGIPFYQAAAEESGLEDTWIVTSLPGATEEDARSIQLFVPSQALLVSTPEQELATWLFVRFLAEKAPQELWSSSTGYLSIRNDVELTEDTFTGDLPFSSFQDVLALVTDPEMVIYASPGIPSYSAVRGLIADAVAEVTTGGRDVAEVAQELTDEANELREELDF